MHSSWKISAVSCLVFCGSLRAAPGNEVGNGGNAVVCADRVEMLDVYEAKILRKVVPSPSIRGTDPYALALARLALLAKLDLKSAKVFTSGVELLRKEMSFEDNLTIRPIDDSQHAFEPSEAGCRVEQLAVFRKQSLPGEKLVLVNDRWWKRMKPLHQAALLLHESIYRYLANLGESDSTKARYLNTYLLSEEVEHATVKSYWKTIKDLRLPIYP